MNVHGNVCPSIDDRDVKNVRGDGAKLRMKNDAINRALGLGRAWGLLDANDTTLYALFFVNEVDAASGSSAAPQNSACLTHTACVAFAGSEQTREAVSPRLSAADGPADALNRIIPDANCEILSSRARCMSLRMKISPPRDSSFLLQDETRPADRCVRTYEPYSIAGVTWLRTICNLRAMRITGVR